jgi:hypothetical protein
MTRPIRSRRRVLACAAALLTVSALPRSASAKPSKNQCVDADTQAQDLRRDGKLLGAREVLRVCTDAACPRLVREDCTQRLDELSRALPSLIFSAKDGAGRDLSAVTVTIDGKPWVDHLDGSALDVDPGEHTFGFEAAGLPPATLKLLLREGERGRHAEVVIGPVAAPLTSAPSQDGATNGDAAAKDAEPDASSSGGTQRVVAWTALGLGAAGVVVGSVFGLKSKAKHDDAKACGTTCPDVPSHDANQDALKFGNISTVAFIVGAVGIASGVTLWLTAKPSQASSSSSAQVGVGLGSLQFRGSF